MFQDRIDSFQLIIQKEIILLAGDSDQQFHYWNDYGCIEWY